MVSDNSLEIGVLVAFVMYVQRFFDPIRNLTQQYTQLQRSMASGSRIFDLMDRIPDMKDVNDAGEMPSIEGKIEFRDVRFSYVENEVVLKGINLTVEPGQTIAVVGPTGAGKTSIVSLLSRFYEVEEGNGAVLVDDRDIRTVTRKSLVSQMSTVLQDPFLFSGTVRENIKYNHRDSSDEHMMTAAKAVGAHEFIVNLENGYDTYLSERGANLSLGQRQLLSFARAIVADPRILILDEATSAVDNQTELLLQKALNIISKNRTTIVIAHRLSTVRNADKIIVLGNDDIIEQGNHNQLIENNSIYKKLWDIQTGQYENI